MGAPTTDKGKGKKRTADEAGLSAQDTEVEEMRKWKVARLRTALQGRELSIKGRRPELVARLERAIRGEGGAGATGGESSGSSSGGGSSSRRTSGRGRAA